MPAFPPLSVLDLSPIPEGSDAAQSLRNTLDLARHCERLGFRRYWLAEHHSMPGIASAATAVVIGHVAAGTSTIRVGAGGIMLTISRTRVDCFAIENVQNRNYAHLLNAGRLQVGANPRTIKRRLSRRTEHA